MPAEEWLARQSTLIGEEKTEYLKRKSVLIFGVGGVGGYAVEAVARTGIGRITVVDRDTVSESNRNRQLLALTDTVGREKVAVCAERIAKINPGCRVQALAVFATEENLPGILDAASPDFIIDAIDCVKTKVALAVLAQERGIPLVSSMGTGNKLHPELLRLADLSKTSVCPLARAVRRELKERGILHLPVLFSTELPVKTGQRTPASVSFVPAAAGILIASYVINRLLDSAEPTA